MSEQAFVTASRIKLRFASVNGVLSVEDLWDLSLKALDAVAVNVDSKLSARTKSFLENPDGKVDREQADNTLRLEILKVVITTKENENKARREASRKTQQLELLKKLRSEKQLQELEGKTLEDLDKQIAELEGSAAPAPAAAE